MSTQNKFAIKPTYFVDKEQFEKLRKAGAKLHRIYINSSNHKSYEGRRKNKRDYFWGFRAETDKHDFICRD